jgi:pimeloyl-ACP methyl ester carboxylesterase
MLVHGFTGGDFSWGKLPDFLRNDPSVRDYHVFVWCYPGGLNKDAAKLKFGWASDPAIDTIGKSLRTILDHDVPKDVERIVLAGHSMGGLVIQAFILEELLAGRTRHLSRVSEVVLLGTPSAGLSKARWFGFLSRQISNMATNSDFIRDLRTNWTRHVEQRRAATDAEASFRLTVVAGDKDAFVPVESSLGPFPLDEQAVVPGDHRTMVKPENEEALLVRMLREILTRDTPTPEQLRIVHGRTPEAIGWSARIAAARELNSTPALEDLGREITSLTQPMPRVWKQLALALLGQARFADAAEWLERYLNFEFPKGKKPFENDIEARQQLAIALCGDDRMSESLQLLTSLRGSNALNTETRGILAGRLKRHWWANQGAPELGFRALRQYRDAFALAKCAHDTPQAIYNGINAAYMEFALRDPGAQSTAREVLELCDASLEKDYWTLASRAEALLLLIRPESSEAYRFAFSHAPSPRAWASTAVQAMDIIARIASPPATHELEQFLTTQARPSVDALS